MSIVSSNGSGVIVDRAKSVQSYIWKIPAGPSTPVTITPTEPQQGVSISNDSNNYIRVRVSFAPGINCAVSPPERTQIIPPYKSHAIDLAAKHAGDSVSSHPIASINMDVIDPPGAGAPIETSIMPAGVAVEGVVSINFASA